MAKSIEEKILTVISKIQPYIRMHGGDVALLGIEKGVVKLKVTGACTHCSLADLTYNKMLGGLLMQEVPGIKKVVLEMDL